MNKAILNTELQGLLARNDLQQKELSINANISNSSLNGYVNQKHPVPINKAVDIAKANGDDIFISQLSYEYLGFIKSMDGVLSEVCSVAELDILQVRESNERKELKTYTLDLTIKAKRQELTKDELAIVKRYALELLDEIVVELSVVLTLLKLTKTTLRNAIASRMPEWISNGYMKG